MPKYQINNQIFVFQYVVFLSSYSWIIAFSCTVRKKGWIFYDESLYQVEISPLIRPEYGKIRTRKKLRIWILFTQCNLFQISGNTPSTSVARIESSDAYISCIVKSNCEMQELSGKKPDRHKHSIKKTDSNWITNQGGLNKKEIQLNRCKIFSILIFDEVYLFA